ncbi:hypothetical protein OGR47_20930 (plasmid) [Methylocystis sp. MJC1]|uniref:hypothetical protein n=2 Tax=Methylocystis sp. MJC1 TaxID=2654282 RepID=UPI0013EBCF8E|nr:hypothetical protein [Methylocystis sp. MJC1]KAF2989332.1 hypothetical protein MJC1_03650 [Methylocystis sp. MJC1]MBU6529361.1 hypothetical protein [Methylocystis sp. MJC1]UZX14221.1 hypothetical protein OGR47_20930 [Methylocystis sp. MJC1]
MARRDIGAIGENDFLSWCEPEGFRAQKSHVDRLGWDFLLESEPLRTRDRPLDAQNDLPKFLIQVKSTETSGKAPRIKLSALKHLVDADLPAAVVTLFYAKGARLPTRGLLVPVDDALVTDTLRRVRREEARGNHSIHRTTIPVPLDRAIEISPTGEGLARALNTMIGGAVSTYIAAKISHRQTCGFEDKALVGTFFVPGERAAKKLSHLFLGGPRELRVFDLTIERRRFGIALENDRDHFRRAVLEVDAPPLLTSTIELATIEGEWISLQMDGFFPPPLQRDVSGPLRFANRYLEFVLDFDDENAGLSFDYNGDRIVPFEEAVDMVEVGSILARQEKTLTIRFKGTRLDLAMSPEVGPFGHWLHAAPTLRRIVSALSRSNRHYAYQVELRSFYEWIEAHNEYLALLSTPGVHMTFPRWSDDAIVEHQDAILTPFSLVVGDAEYTALIEIPIASVKRAEDAITVVGGQPNVVADVVRRAGADTNDFIESAIERSKRQRKKFEPALVAGGFENWRTVMLPVSQVA